MQMESGVEKNETYRVTHKEKLNTFVITPIGKKNVPRTTTSYHFLIRCIDRPDREVILDRNMRFILKENEPRDRHPVVHRRLIERILESRAFMNYIIQNDRVLIDPALQVIKVRELSVDYAAITLAVEAKNL